MQGASISRREDRVLSSHSINFQDHIESALATAYQNELLNQRPKEHRPTGSGRKKKSPVQNGASAVSCLLTYVRLESLIRLSYFRVKQQGGPEVHDSNLMGLARTLLNDNTYLRDLDTYLQELTIMRDIIVHGYLFAGTLVWDSELHRLVSMSEQAITGMKKDKIGERTACLRINTSPNQMSFLDAAKFYLAFDLICEMLDIQLPLELWDAEGDWNASELELEPREWISLACRRLHYLPQNKILSELIKKCEEVEARKFWPTAQGKNSLIHD